MQEWIFLPRLLKAKYIHQIFKEGTYKELRILERGLWLKSKSEQNYVDKFCVILSNWFYILTAHTRGNKN